MKYILILAITFFLGCSAGKKLTEETTTQRPGIIYDESFDPLSLDDDDLVITFDSEQGQTTSTLEHDDQGELSQLLNEINGFRVQILATSNIENASLVEQEAAEKFSDKGQKIYLLFEAPLYKIRVGDCKERGEAEELRDLARQYGYREAFIVKTKVLSIR